MFALIKENLWTCQKSSLNVWGLHSGFSCAGRIVLTQGCTHGGDRASWW